MARPVGGFGDFVDGFIFVQIRACRIFSHHLTSLIATYGIGRTSTINKKSPNFTIKIGLSTTLHTNKNISLITG